MPNLTILFPSFSISCRGLTQNYLSFSNRSIYFMQQGSVIQLYYCTTWTFYGAFGCQVIAGCHCVAKCVCSDQMACIHMARPAQSMNFPRTLVTSHSLALPLSNVQFYFILRIRKYNALLCTLHREYIQVVKGVRPVALLHHRQLQYHHSPPKNL